MVKHPLQNRWSLWFFKNDKAKNWAANLRQITTFDSVEDFWSIYNPVSYTHLTLPTILLV